MQGAADSVCQREGLCLSCTTRRLADHQACLEACIPAHEARHGHTGGLLVPPAVVNETPERCVPRCIVRLLKVSLRHCVTTRIIQVVTR